MPHTTSNRFKNVIYGAELFFSLFLVKIKEREFNSQRYQVFLSKNPRSQALAIFLFLRCIFEIWKKCPFIEGFLRKTAVVQAGKVCRTPVTCFVNILLHNIPK